MEYKTIAELVNTAADKGLKISELVLKDQSKFLEETEAECFGRMEENCRGLP